MFLTLLALTFLVSLFICVAAVALFWAPLGSMLRNSLSEGAASIWLRGIALAVIVIGVSVGTRVWDLERYARGAEALSTDALALEVYRTAIATAQAGVATLVVIFLAIGVMALMRRRGDQQ